MRLVLLGLIFFVVAAGGAVADTQEKASQPSQGFKKEKVVKLTGGLYTKMYIKAYYEAKGLEIDKEQRRELKNSAEIYAQQIMTEESNARMLQKVFMKELEVSPFDSERLKELAAEIMKSKTKTVDSFIDGLAEIEKIIGPKNFAKLAPIRKFDRSALVQLKKSNADNPLGEEKETTEKPSEDSGSN